MKTIRAKQAEVHSAYLYNWRDQHGIIARDLTQSSILMWRFRFPWSSRRSFLNSLVLYAPCGFFSLAMVTALNDIFMGNIDMLIDLLLTRMWYLCI